MVKFENKVFICHCSRLSLSLKKTGCGSAQAKLKTAFSICLCSHLSVSLYLEVTKKV